MVSTSPITDIFINAERAVLPQAAEAVIATQQSGIEEQKLSPEQINEVAQDFEAMFLAQMLQALKPEESDKDSLFNDSESDAVFRTMIMEEYAKEIAKSGGIGIASYIERELLGTQEVQTRPVNYDLKMGSYEKTNELIDNDKNQSNQLGGAL